MKQAQGKNFLLILQLQSSVHAQIFFVFIFETGHDPFVCVWDLQNSTKLAQTAGHKFGVQCIRFCSTNNDVTISLSEQHAQQLLLWNWKTKEILASMEVKKLFVSTFVFSTRFFFILFRQLT